LPGLTGGNFLKSNFSIRNKGGLYYYLKEVYNNNRPLPFLWTKTQGRQNELLSFWQ
jgi:hypothetical protein